MSFFSSMFGGGTTAAKKELPKKAIADMRVQIEMLQKKAKHLETQIEEQTAIARKNVTTNKNRKYLYF
jgi:charged multivesicular body protein 4